VTSVDVGSKVVCLTLRLAIADSFIHINDKKIGMVQAMRLYNGVF